MMIVNGCMYMNTAAVAPDRYRMWTKHARLAGGVILYYGMTHRVAKVLQNLTRIIERNEHGNDVWIYGKLTFVMRVWSSYIAQYFETWSIYIIDCILASRCIRSKLLACLDDISNPCRWCLTNWPLRDAAVSFETISKLNGSIYHVHSLSNEWHWRPTHH